MMRRLREISLEDIGGGINLLDLGASGQLPDYWKPLSHLTNIIGFDPNADECDRLNQQKTGFHSQIFLPYPISGETREFTLYKTKSIYCWSLLEPNLKWLRRFSFSDLFEMVSSDAIAAYALADVPEIQGVDVDAMKLDTQGLELPILKAAQRLVESCILIETETGFCENYKGETTFDQIAQYMSSMGFSLFDINADHRIPRRNTLAGASRQEQILWCEAIWMRDLLSTDHEAVVNLSREKALKALCLYANHGCYSFGLEAAEFFYNKGLIWKEEYETLRHDVSCWELGTRKQRRSLKKKLLRSTLDLVPRRFFGSIVSVLEDLRRSRHPIARLLRS